MLQDKDVDNIRQGYPYGIIRQQYTFDQTYFGQDIWSNKIYILIGTFYKFTIIQKVSRATNFIRSDYIVLKCLWQYFNRDILLWTDNSFLRVGNKGN